MKEEQGSLFLFLMGLAWRYRLSMPLLLSCSLALLGNAWMFQIRVQTHRLHERELELLEEDDDTLSTSDLDSTDSWETMVEEVAYG